MNAATVLSIVTLIAHVNGLDPRIVGGTPAKEGQYPYQALVKVTIPEGYMLCGGSIISKRFVLTAAHCIYLKKPEKCTVTVGTLKLYDSGETYQADRLIHHEKYDPNKIENDIGLIRINKDIQFHRNVQPIELPISVYEVPRNAVAVLTGWGKLATHSNVADNLQQINLTVISESECKAYWPITERQICTLMKRNQGACRVNRVNWIFKVMWNEEILRKTPTIPPKPEIKINSYDVGDSGGPLVVNNLQVGIVSYGNIVCADNLPDVFTRVSFYKSWIEDAMYKNSAPSTQATLLFAISVIALHLYSSL